LGIVKSIDTFDDFTRIFFEQKYKELVLAALQNFNQFLSLLSIELTGKANVAYRIHHELFVRLTRKRIFSLFWLDFRLQF